MAPTLSVRFMLLAAAAVLATVAAGPIPLHGKISATQTQAVLRGALQAARLQNLAVSIVVVDFHGTMTGFYRMDGASQVSVDISMQKARASSLFNVTSGQFGVLSHPGQTSFAIEMSNGRSMMGIKGAVPLYTNGNDMVGAVGVSGATYDQDEQIAVAGAAQLNAVPNTDPIVEGPVYGSGITLRQAVQLVNASISLAWARGLQSSVAVVDSTNNLKAFMRMDGADIGSVDLATRKAKASRLFNGPTDILQTYAQPNVIWRFELNNGGMALVPGGLPLNDKSGRPLGAIGVDSGSATIANQMTNKEIAAAGLAAFTPSQRDIPFEEREGLTLEQAKRMLMAAVAKSASIGVPMDIAIVDAGGNLRAFYRMDGACLPCMDVAIKKARSAVGFQLTSDTLGKMAQPFPKDTDGPLWRIEFANEGSILFGGGIPVLDKSGHILGAIGCSTGSIDEDTQCAQAGWEAWDKTDPIPNAIPETSIEDRCTLSLEYAYRALTVGEKIARDEYKLDYVHALSDAGGHLKALWRGDNAYLGSLDIAQRKAWLSATSGLNSSDLGALSKPGGILYTIEVSNGGLVTFGGGQPIIRSGKLIGGYGSSTGSVPQDVRVTSGAVAALLAAMPTECGVPKPPSPCPDPESKPSPWGYVGAAAGSFVVGMALMFFVMRARRPASSTHALLPE